MKARRVACGAKPCHPACEPGLTRRLHSLHRATWPVPRCQCHDAHHHFPRLRHPAHSTGLRRSAILAGHSPCADGAVAAAAAPAEAAKPAAAEAAQLGKSDSVSSKKSAKPEPEPEPKPKKKAEAVAEPPAASKVPRHGHYGSHARSHAHAHCTSFWLRRHGPSSARSSARRHWSPPTSKRTHARTHEHARTNTLAGNCRPAIHGTGPDATGVLLLEIDALRRP